MDTKTFPSLMKTWRLLLSPLLVLSACGEGLPEGGSSKDASLQQARESLMTYEDLSCQGVTVGGWTRDTNGWTVFPDPQAIGGRKVYVSNPVTGTSDPTNGIYYVSTLADGLLLMRKGYPDALYLARGQEFSGTIAASRLGGASITQPMVIRSYGTGVRPVLNGRIDFGSSSVSNLAFVDLDVQGDGTGYGVWWARTHTAGQPPGSRNILFENTRFQRFQSGLSIQSRQDSYTPAIFFENITLRRSQVLDNWGNSHSQGIYAEGIQGLSIEESVFDHNGFLDRNNPTYDLSATIFAHNMYLHSSNKCLRVIGTVSANAASHGLQARAGGVVQDNFFVRNPLAVTWGLVNGDAVTNNLIPAGLSGSIVGNVVWESTDINSATPRDGGIEIGNALKLLVQNNVAAHHLRGNVAGTGLILSARMGIGLHNMLIEGNSVHNLARAFEFYGNGWGPVTVRTDGSVADPSGNTLITADASGLAPRGSSLSISDTGSFFQNNRASRVAKIITASTNGGHTTRIDYASNYYDCLNGTASCTSYGSLSNWLSQTGELGYKVGLVPFIDSSRSIATYWVQLFPGTPLPTKDTAYQNYMNRVRDMERRTWDARFTAPAITSYLRAGFAVP
ncbi:hypothetical protein [Archangium sp.]|uniref:hypothetical protein n=1 Tax=Archangium sp. TaxID=1872627 RepID=UPI002D31F847|nr:hypothetical protein [Archangium sp.]HYO53184.1 hypothetical protein [Archangium sp.]